MSGGEPLSDELEEKINETEKRMADAYLGYKGSPFSILRAFAREIQTDTLAEEVGTNLRIAERIGIVESIKAGKAYEDAEVELFDGLRAALLASQESVKSLEMSARWQEERAVKAEESAKALADVLEQIAADNDPDDGCAYAPDAIAALTAYRASEAGRGK